MLATYQFFKVKEKLFHLALACKRALTSHFPSLTHHDQVVGNKEVYAQRIVPPSIPSCWRLANAPKVKEKRFHLGLACKRALTNYFPNDL